MDVAKRPGGYVPRTATGGHHDETKQVSKDFARSHVCFLSSFFYISTSLPRTALDAAHTLYL